MKDIYILGSGGFAKEVYWLIKDINLVHQLYKFKGFIDFEVKHNSLVIGKNEFEVFDEDSFLNLKDSMIDNVNLAIGIGAPQTIKKLVEKFEDFSFPNLMHPSFKFDACSVSFGVGNIITAGCVFTVNIQVGSFNIFNLNSTVGHDTLIGSGNVINPGCNISGGVKLLNYNLLGTNSTILQNITIGSDSILGAASLANRNIGTRQVSVGVPAKIIKDNI